MVPQGTERKGKVLLLRGKWTINRQKRQAERLLQNRVGQPRAGWMEGDDDVPDMDPLGVAFLRG